ncbi:SAYSvFN domain-containing protein 1 [Triplophysa rosa]|uniref:SAYSvFN domain-containing protein 1 n=1 Tax=Triplophysa rosa TaxID=992332 RepID=A0A9W7TJJ6_TRIRA|nr:SAYSvFN domain-containing protein 1 [Triplophysa rosa]KAI7800023.1 SAYSvFN domain-containing protein 1 [Triplophysa rosa]
MERKLAEYRSRKKAQKDPADRDMQPEMTVKDHNECSTESSVTPQLKPTTCSQTTHTEADGLASGSGAGHWLLSRLTLLKVLLWLVLLGLFSELGFGFPFFLISLFYWLYEGFRSPKARQPGEMSAYSVFNPDCQPILGTLTAEQLEGEMGYRPMARR